MTDTAYLEAIRHRLQLALATMLPGAEKDTAINLLAETQRRLANAREAERER